MLAEYLKTNYGSRIHCYVRTQREADGLTRDFPDPVWDTLTVADALNKTINSPVTDEDALFQRARDYETMIGSTINRVMMGDRQLNRGFSLAGFKALRRRSFLQSSYAQRVNAVVAALAFWEREFREKAISLVIDGDIEAGTMARALGVPYRRLHLARYKNRQFWAPDLYQTNPAVAERYASIRGDAPVDLEGSYHAAITKTKATLNQANYLNMARAIPINVAKYLVQWARGVEGVRDYPLSGLIVGPLRMRPCLSSVDTDRDDDT